MKLMKETMARESRKTKEVLDDFIREVGDMKETSDGEGDGHGSNEEDEDAVAARRTGGRVVFHPAATVSVLMPASLICEVDVFRIGLMLFKRPKQFRCLL